MEPCATRPRDNAASTLGLTTERSSATQKVQRHGRSDETWQNRSEKDGSSRSLGISEVTGHHLRFFPSEVKRGPIDVWTT